uniref:Uncharacterized protein n=1 Tax=Anguilla anguilla TaxID=7936 RepID=A0A0E9TJB0_ANGAN
MIILLILQVQQLFGSQHRHMTNYTIRD